MAAAGIRTKFCELCGAEAHLHCEADAAFLCRSCDAEVHASNFLVARHVRRLICRSCRSVTGNCMSGPVFRGRSFRCKSCSSLLSSSSSSSASSCYSALDCVSSCKLSSTDAREKRSRRRRKRKSVASRRRLAEGRNHGEADGVFVKWCEKLGLAGNSRNAVVSSASWALALCLERLTPMLPFRLSLAASFWFGVRTSGNGSEAVKWQNLKRVEELSGVPGKVIVAVGIRLARALRLRRWRLDTEEGWAESGGAGA